MEQIFGVAIAGPLVGCLPILFLAPIGLIFDLPWFLEAACWIAALNFLNLLPVFPLDGGRILMSLAHSLPPWLGSLVMIGAGSAVAGVLFYMDKHGWAGIACAATAFGAIGIAADDKVEDRISNPALALAIYAILFATLGALWFFSGHKPDDLFLI